MDDPPLQRVAISGPTLASLIQRLSSAAGDVSGLLFGRISDVPSSALRDDGDPSSGETSPDEPTSTLVATITGFLCVPSFYDSYGHLRDASALRSILADRGTRGSLLGWFSGRRRTPLRPSMRECSVSSSLSAFENASGSGSIDLRPCLFVLLATPLADQIVHRHEYQAYQYRPSTDSFECRSIDVKNVGTAFRGQYGAFTTASPFPALPFVPRRASSGLGFPSSAIAEDREGKNLSNLNSVFPGGLEMGNLSRLMGSEAASYTSGVENLYEEMLSKLKDLAGLVGSTSAKVLEQEELNVKLRIKVTSLD